MCYDTNARPPEGPGASGAATGEDIALVSADGTHFAAYVARAGGAAARAQIIIFPDVRGLHQFYKELALRFAEVGITALVLDYFGRTAGIGSRDDSFDFMPHVQQIQLETLFADVASARAYLRTGEGATRAI